MSCLRNGITLLLVVENKKRLHEKAIPVVVCPFVQSLHSTDIITLQSGLVKGVIKFPSGCRSTEKPLFRMTGRSVKQSEKRSRACRCFIWPAGLVRQNSASEGKTKRKEWNLRVCRADVSPGEIPQKDTAQTMRCRFFRAKRFSQGGLGAKRGACCSSKKRALCAQFLFLVVCSGRQAKIRGEI